MSVDELIVLCVVLGAIVLFISEKLSLDLVALLIVATLMITGVITPKEGLAGFSDPATLTVAFMFVLSAGLLSSGVLNTIGPRLADQLRKSEVLGLLLLMVTVAFFSAFLNNTPIVAVLIPVAVQAARAAGINPARILMPLSFAAILGGTTTLIGTSTNLLVSGLAADSGLEPFTMFQLSPMGLVILFVGILYMVFFGRKLLPKEADSESLKDDFGVKEYVTELELLPSAPSVGRRIMDSALVKEMHMDIIEIRRGGNVFTVPAGDVVLQANDVLKVRCDVEHIRVMKERAHVRLIPTEAIEVQDTRNKGTRLVELVITSTSPLDGRTIREADLLRKYRAVALAVRRREELVQESMQNMVLRSGDVILAEVRTHYVARLRELGRTPDSPFVILAEQEGEPEFNKRNAVIVALVMLGVIFTSALGILPIVVSTLIGVCIIVLTRCMSMKDVYDAIDWKIVFLMAGAISLGLAMESCGLADRIAGGLIGVLGGWGPIAVLSGLYLCTVMFTEVMSNTATAALMVPIAISAAVGMDVSPLPMLMAVTFAASASFMTPIGYQTNTMIYSAGRYKFMDFARVGGPMTILFWILATLLIPVFYPF